MKKFNSILAMSLLVSSCVSSNGLKDRAPSSEAQGVEVFLLHDYVRITEGSADNDPYRTSLGYLDSAYQLNSGHIEIEIAKDGKKTKVLINKYSTNDTLKLFQAQSKEGKIEIHAKNNNFDSALTISSIETQDDNLRPFLRHEKTYNLDAGNIVVNYRHKFLYREFDMDDDLKKTHLGTAYKIKFKEMGPEYTWNTIVL